MKKILFLILLLPILMGMKIVYQNETGDIIAIGPFTNYQLKDGESTIDEPNSLPENINTHIVKNDQFRERNAQERQALKDSQKQKSDNFKSKRDSLKQKLNLTDDEIKTLRELIRGEG